MKLMVLAIFFASSLLLALSATSVPVSRVDRQTKSGVLTHVYFETISGPASSTPSTNTAQTPPIGTGSYQIAKGGDGYLWSPQFTSTSTISAGNWVLDLWGALVSSAITDIPITITNTQSSATPNPFQQKITWNPSSYTIYEASNLGNIRFYSDSACNTPIYAWLESSTPSLSNNASSATAWIKLTSPIAGNGGTLTIYMAFLSTSTDFDGNYWGVAPNLSGTYGQYDNGANVFSFYDDFKGTSLSSKWTTVRSSGATVNVNDGITFTTSTSNDYAFVVSAQQVYPKIAEAYLTSANSTVDPMLGVSVSRNVNNWVALYRGYSVDAITSQLELVSQRPLGGTLVNSTSLSGINLGIWQLIWSSTGSESASDGVHILTGTNSASAIANYRIYVGQSNYGSGSNSFRWARMRAYPPNNVIPTFSFGAMTSPVDSAGVSIYVTDSNGNILSTVASYVQSPSIGISEAQIVLTITGGQVSVPQNGYIMVKILATSTPYTIYWGTGQLTNFQVPYRVLS